MRANTALLVFARAPVAGLAKTRLIPVVGAEGAAALHARLARQALARMVGQALWDVQLWCSPDRSHPFFQRCAEDFGVSLHDQEGKDLGSRMGHAIQTALRSYHQALLIGTDCPDLRLEDLCQASAALGQGSDVVLGPATDGGYYLIGMRRAQPALFEGMAWGSDSVLGATRDKLDSLGLRWHELDEHHDLDTPADLAHYPWLMASI